MRFRVAHSRSPARSHSAYPADRLLRIEYGRKPQCGDGFGAGRDLPRRSALRPKVKEHFRAHSKRFRHIRLPAGVSCGLFDAEKNSLYASEESFALNGAPIIYGKQTVRMVDRKNAEGTPVMYAIYLYEDGAFLAFSAGKSRAGVTALSAGAAASIPLLHLHRTCGGPCLSPCWCAVDSKATAGRYAPCDTLDEFAGRQFRRAHRTDSRRTTMRGSGIQRRSSSASRAAFSSSAARTTRMSVVMSQMQNGIIAVDQDLRVILVTPVAKKLLGIVGNSGGHA